ncbi:hypothetical protein LJR034_007153 [Caballeronia sp. LjRoot34]|uniref:hypothetical protein n=1 Tax=Caballeronia sp. LjRoot34 TaxID=3342325 RepID=UPI003ECE2161
MQTMLRTIKRIFLAGVLGGACSPLIAMQPLPVSVEISDGRIVTVRENHLYVQEQDARISYTIQLPNTLRHELASASGVAFPESHSLLVDGNEYILFIVDHSSGQPPEGYCGAGNEGELYALQITGTLAKVKFSKLVQSCLKNIELSSDGTTSPYRSVAWNKTPVGISIAWMSDSFGRTITRLYQLNHGQFNEIPVAK